MKSRYTILLILAAFLTLDLVCVDEVFSMSRLQWTLPQEFGLYTQFLCALFLIRYLRGEREQRKENGKTTKIYHNHHGVPGHRMMKAYLAKDGIILSKTSVHKYMNKLLGLKSVVRRANPNYHH